MTHYDNITLSCCAITGKFVAASITLKLKSRYLVVNKGQMLARFRRCRTQCRGMLSSATRTAATCSHAPSSSHHRVPTSASSPTRESSRSLHSLTTITTQYSPTGWSFSVRMIQLQCPLSHMFIFICGRQERTSLCYCRQYLSNCLVRLDKHSKMH